MLKDQNIKVITLDDVCNIEKVEEDGRTFAENAIKKAVQTAKMTGKYCLADDSGLVVDALEGQPGIYSARFAGEGADDRDNNEKLINMMRDVEEEQRTARFVCVIAISNPEGEYKIVQGTCEGTIAFQAVGDGGFGYDPLFIPQGFSQSFAELSAAEKNKISHRGRALVNAVPVINEFLGN